MIGSSRGIEAPSGWRTCGSGSGGSQVGGRASSADTPIPAVTSVAASTAQNCAGAESDTPTSAVKRPARPCKSAMENRFTTENADGASPPRAGPYREGEDPVVAVLLQATNLYPHHALCFNMRDTGYDTNARSRQARRAPLRRSCRTWPASGEARAIIRRCGCIQCILYSTMYTMYADCREAVLVRARRALRLSNLYACPFLLPPCSASWGDANGTGLAQIAAK
jgi:hypothetical protein